MSRWSNPGRGCFPAGFDAFLCFELEIATSTLWLGAYSDQQQLTFETIVRLRAEGLGYRRIADWLNEQGCLSPRGKKFKSPHVHSIPKKKGIRDERLNRKPIAVYRNFRLHLAKRSPLRSLEPR